MRLAVVCLLSLALQTQPSLAQRHAVRLEPYVGNLVLVETEISDQPARMLFDTGAGVTSITPSFARRIGCVPHGRLVGFRMRGDSVEMRKCGRQRLRLGGRELERDVAVFDIGALLPADLPHIDGVMGIDVLAGESFVLDLADREIRWGSRRGWGWREGVVRLDREMGGAGVTAFVRVDAAIGDLWFLMDSANLGPVLLSPGALEQLDLRQPPTGSTSIAVAGAGRHEIDAELAEPLIYDGALNYAFMAQFEISLDLPNSRIWWRDNR